MAAAAAERSPRTVLLDGDGTRALTAAGYECRTYLPIPSAGEPHAWLPLDAPPVSRYALGRWTVASTNLKRARNRLLTSLIARRRAPLRSSWLTVAARSDPMPWFVREAAARVDEPRPSWFLTVGAGESLDYRGVFHLFPDAAAEPRWVVKFARRPGLTSPFERDRAGLAVAAAAGPEAAAHAPALVASFEHAGVPASIETAAAGASLSSLLRSSATRRSKMAVIDALASWIVKLGVDSAAPPDSLGEERERLARVVIPEWRQFGLDVDLSPLIADVPAVAQHNDLWSENVVVDGRSFTVVDWEDARRHGLPLWDLVYFLADALALLDRAFDDRSRHEHFVSLFKGRARTSPFFFDHVRRAAEACSVPGDAVGPIVTACWLSQVLEHATRGEDAERFAIHGLSKLPPGEQWATLWLSDPELGPGWSSWRA